MIPTWPNGKPIVWLEGAVKTPPMSKAARLEAGWLLRHLQDGESLSMPCSRPMPAIGRRCHELRIQDEDHNWRIVYRIDPDALIVLAIFDKRTPSTPRHVIRACAGRLRRYDSIH
jgi:phage-related protein